MRNEKWGKAKNPFLLPLYSFLFLPYHLNFDLPLKTWFNTEMLLHLIADFGYSDLAFAEVAQRLKSLLPEAELVLTSVPPFSTLAAGFCVAQLGLNQAPKDMMIFHNVAPRKDNQAARQNNDGERLAYALLPNGVRVVGVNAGYAFSFLKHAATDMCFVNVASAGSQFRSRDIFPQGFLAVAEKQDQALLEVLQPEHIPDVPEGCVAYIDGFGNIKTTFCKTPTVGQTLKVTLAGKTLEVLVSDGSFSVAQGTLTLAPGSSGWIEKGKPIRWTELFLRGGSAYEAFGGPKVGDKIEF
jgi:S-adenosyl-l-methionine hydroxide adenosyltransferase